MHIPELRHIEDLLQYQSPLMSYKTLCRVEYGARHYPVYQITLGRQQGSAPTMTFVGGVHGVERIGAQVAIAFLESLIQRLQWDQSLIDMLSRMRLVFIPLVNPVGTGLRWRANGNGVDLMRNAPLDAQRRPAFLAGGHRLTSVLPWYRGAEGAAMEKESQALCDTIEQLTADSPIHLVLDLHSGFGLTDRIWFPYAYSTRPVHHIGELYTLKLLLNRTYPYLNYLFEPQSLHYTCHGDLWDYLYLRAKDNQQLLLPLTLEMGSWRWVKKNPRQLFNFSGLFNPMLPHRTQRVLRRHIILMEFLMRAAESYEHWLPEHNERADMRREAIRHWYELRLH